MSNARRLESLLDAAQGKEKSYDWAEAAKLYEQALGAVGKGDLLKKGEIQEKIGYSFYRAAFQAETQREFKRLIRMSAETYRRAAELFEELGSSKEQARVNLCRARAAYSRWWLADDPTDRTTLLDECRTLCKDAAKAYAEIGDHLGQGLACNELLICLLDRSVLAQDAEALKNIMEEWLAYGEQAIHALAATGEEHALTRAYHQLSLGYTLAHDLYESVEKQKTLQQHALSYAEQAVEVAERTGDQYLIGWSSLALDSARWFVKADVEAALKQLENTLELATMTRDTSLIAWVRERQAYHRGWYAGTVEDPDKRREERHKAIRAAEEAIARFELLSYPFTDAYYLHPSSYVQLAWDETDLAKKRGLLMKAAELAGAYLQRIQRSGSPWHVWCMHPLSSALNRLAAIETETGEKRRLLTQAAEYREAAINTWDRVRPFDYWNRAMVRARLPVIKVELAKLEPDRQKKRDLLTAAAVTMDETLKLIRKRLKAYAAPPVAHTAQVGGLQDLYGGVLHQLYLVTGEKLYLERAIRSCEDAVEAWEKVGQQSRMAEAHWQKAKFYDQLGEHLKAAHAFATATEAYRQAAAKLPQLKTFYTDHAVYMQAWSEIENARHAHTRKQYGQANGHYTKAATLHEQTERWGYLSPNYMAWARLEEGEDLSRREQTEEARALFQQAAKLFVEAKKAIQAKSEEIEGKDETEMLVQLAKASDVRREYCVGRIALEEAINLDRKGDHSASSKKYGLAAETFQKTAKIESEQSRRELQPIVYLCQAWQKMMMAEAKASSTIYAEAAELFGQAKEHTLDQPTSLLALAHSSFCKALEAGTEFETTGDITMYSTAKRHLEAAARHYLKAGLKSASEYARATHRLFDAYMYMHKAETETDPRKKAQYYEMTEKLLQTSAGSFMKAKHPEKSQEVGRLLESVKEERQLAISLTEVLHAPTIASTTTSFSTPTPTHEQAVGLERFEHADVQANLILRVKEVRVGEDIRLAIEVVNAGKAPALLIKVDEVIPEGFEIREVPEMYTFEDSYINMKGKRLNPLKTEDVKIVVKPRSKGTHTINPRILYIDETGKYKSHEPEPVTVTVKELGIKGWIRGER